MTMLTANFTALTNANVQRMIGEAFLLAPLEFQPVVNMMSSSRNYEIVSGIGAFGNAIVKGEGENISVDTAEQRYTKTFTHNAIALGFRVSDELKADQQIGQVQKWATSLGGSVSNKMNADVAAQFDNGTTSTGAYGVPGGSKALLATDHPTAGGTASNTPASAVDFSNSALAAGFAALRKQVDHRGKILALRPSKVVAAVEQERVISQALGSELESATTDNQMNFYKTKGLSGVFLSHMTDADAWYLMSDQHCFDFYMRVAPHTGSYEPQGSPGDEVFYIKCRYSLGFSDWRGVYGTLGAA